MSDKFKFTTRRNPRTSRTTYMVNCKAPSGIEAWRIVSKDWYMKNKK